MWSFSYKLHYLFSVYWIRWINVADIKNFRIKQKVSSYPHIIPPNASTNLLVCIKFSLFCSLFKLQQIGFDAQIIEQNIHKKTHSPASLVQLNEMQQTINDLLYVYMPLCSTFPYKNNINEYLMFLTRDSMI